MRRRPAASAFGVVGTFTKVARALAGQFDIEVIPTGTKCATDGRRIFIPFTADHLDETTQRVLNGQLDHEVSHVLEERYHADAGRTTPMQLLNRLPLHTKQGRIMKVLFNAYEDVHIERKWGRRYPGMADHFAFMNQHMLELIKRRSPESKAKNGFWMELAYGIIYTCEGHTTEGWLRDDVAPYLSLVEEEMSRAFSAPWAEDRLALARSTYDKLIDKAKKAKEEREAPPPPPPEDTPEESTEPGGEEGGSGGSESDEQEEGCPSSEDAAEAPPEPGEGCSEEEAPAEEAPDSEEETPADDAADSEESADSDEETPADDAADSEESADSDEGSLDEEASLEDERGVDEDVGADDDVDDIGADGVGGEEASDEGEGEEAEESRALIISGMGGGDASDGEYADSFELACDDVLKDDVESDDVRDVARRAIDEVIKADIREHRRYVPHPMMLAADKFETPVVHERFRSAALEHYRQALETVNSQVAALRGRQQALLQTMARTRIYSGLDSGTVDDALLPGVRIGDRRVFSDRSRKMDMDTSIEVLVDLSGSMQDNERPGTCAYYAERAVIALAESWESLCIPYEIMGFYNNASSHAFRAVDWRAATAEGYVMRSPFRYLVFKGWDEKLKPCRERFIHMHGYEENVDGEAVWAAAQRLSMRKEGRRILVVVSDGRPQHGLTNERILYRDLKDTIKKVTNAGIEVWGVGAGTECPALFYNEETGARNIIIRDLDTLAAKLFEALGKRLAMRSV